MEVASKPYEFDRSRKLPSNKKIIIIAKTYEYYMTEGDYQKLLGYRKDYMGKKNIRGGSTEMAFIDENNETIVRRRRLSSKKAKAKNAKATKKGKK